ncbi:MAG TPA: hypothetical protein VKY73_21685 [Polyangiaceae bacterium]|nr:hypothetical protein [Polyangiaceae bacterium]
MITGTCIDENAFGLLFAYHDIEDEEYGLEREDFVSRFTAFREAMLEHLRASPLGEAVVCIDLGHALYFEVADGDHSTDLLAWLRAASAHLKARDFAVTAVLTHGGRWVDESARDLPAVVEPLPGLALVRATRPSEPLRRALYAEAACHGREGDDGWGAGCYVDEEAVLALKRAFKNSPTPLNVAGATFFRIGS